MLLAKNCLIVDPVLCHIAAQLPVVGCVVCHKVKVLSAGPKGHLSPPPTLTCLAPNLLSSPACFIINISLPLADSFNLSERKLF